jgi:transcriptional regulator with XRE-family HTH domain
MSGKELRVKRVSANLSGQSVCIRANITRSRLSCIENEYITPTPTEMADISAAIDAIIQTRSSVSEMATAAGLSLAGMRL